MPHIDWNLIADFVIANVAGESLKYLVVKLATKIDSKHKTWLDVEQYNILHQK